MKPVVALDVLVLDGTGGLGDRLFRLFLLNDLDHTDDDVAAVVAFLRCGLVLVFFLFARTTRIKNAKRSKNAINETTEYMAFQSMPHLDCVQSHSVLLQIKKL